MTLGGLQRMHTGFVDHRMPWLPDEDLLENIINDEATYPSPYPNDITPSIYTGVTLSLDGREESVKNSSSIFHAVDRLKCVADISIVLHKGAIACADHVDLRSRVVKILDDVHDWPIRTTCIAMRHLKIRAEELFIDGADILNGGTFEIKADFISFKNPTPNSQWLFDALRDQIEET